MYSAPESGIEDQLQMFCSIFVRDLNIIFSDMLFLFIGKVNIHGLLFVQFQSSALGSVIDFVNGVLKTLN